MPVTQPHLILFIGNGFAGKSRIMTALRRAHASTYRIVLTPTEQTILRALAQHHALLSVSPESVYDYRTLCPTIVVHVTPTHRAIDPRSPERIALDDRERHVFVNPDIVLENSFAPGALPLTVERLHAKILSLTVP